jgi:Caspase domain
MTLLYEKALPQGSGTHVLAIGVGHYAHLIDGAGPLAANPLGLAQLTSPPISAKAFIDWCLAPVLGGSGVGLTNPNSPLLSLEALVSSDTPLIVSTPGGVISIEAATRNNIQTAFESWLARLKENDANIGVFYFCGHGVMVADHYLLAEDFGRSAAQPWERAFDVSNTVRAVEREVKGALYFFIDACREISRSVALTLGANPTALQAVDLTKPVARLSTSVIEATGEGKLAFAVEGRVSRFTEALMTSLSGYCGTKSAGSPTWDVDGETIAASVRKLLENGNKTSNRRQVSAQAISGESVPLLKTSAAPKVKVELDLLPLDMRAIAKLYLQPSKGSVLEHDGAKGVFQTEVPRGFYGVGAKPNGGNAFVEVFLDDQEIFPPLFGLIMQAVV